MRQAWFFVALPFVGACGLISGLDGLHVDDGGADAVVASDAGLDVGSCEGGACGAPVGFQPIWFATDRDTPCTGSLDVVIDPQLPATPGACSCSCKESPGSCLPQPSLSYGSDNGCSSKQTLSVVLDGGCNFAGAGPPPSHMSIEPFPAIGASCASDLSVNGSVTGTDGRVCQVTSCGACQAPAGFELCFAGSIDAGCPTGMTPHQLGATAILSCTPCSACTSTATCAGSVKLYDDNQCTYQTDEIQLNGTCISTQNDVLTAIRYTPSENATCTPGSSTAGISLTEAATVCCP